MELASEMTRLELPLSLAPPPNVSVGLRVSADLDGAGHNSPASFLLRCLPVIPLKQRNHGHFLSDQGPLPDQKAGWLHCLAYAYRTMPGSM